MRGQDQKPEGQKPHRTGSRRHRLLLGGVSLACASLAGIGALAQSGGTTPNPSLTFGIQSSLRFSDNYGLKDPSPGNATFWDNTLSFGYLSETQTQVLRFNASGVARVADLPGTDTDIDFDDPWLRFSYAREGADSRLSATADYRRSDIAFFDPLRMETDPDTLDLVSASGYRESWGVAVSFQTGLNAPLGTFVSASTRTRNYIDTTDPQLFDSRTDAISGGVTMRFSPVFEGRLTLSQSHLTDESILQRDRTTRAISLGGAYAISPAATITANLGYQRIETDQLFLGIIPFTTKQSGTTAGIGYVQELTNGTMAANLDHSFTVNGDRTTLRFSRAFELPQGSFAASAGVTKGESGDAAFIGDLRYQQEMPQGRLSALLSRSVATDSNDQETTTTRATVGWNQDLSALAGLDLSLSYADISPENGTDRQRSSFRAAMTYDLNQDWELSGGYEYRHLNKNTGSASSNTVFMTVGRQFQIRP